ncbi:aspartic peptidase domain-containing protein [Paraphoma chrysanthemicola]|nr:aspartic peptidase domain-containing protein [Paraphoma chrysanthemicola]
MSSLLLLSFVTLIWPVYGQTCQPKALNLPYKSQRLVTNAEVRGVLWQIGGPTAQNVTLMPSAYYNDTYLWSAPLNFCPGWTRQGPACASYRGGLYDRSISQTESDTANNVARTFDDTASNWTKDDIRLQDNGVLPQYEFALRTGSVNEFVHKGELGLGRTSTFLKTLSDNKNISSRSYSFFWGNEVTKEPRDGSLTLGGYDQALVADGPNITTKFTVDEAKCREGIIVSLTSLSLQPTGGASQEAWDSLSDLRVCVIASTSNIMSIPAAYWDPIQSIMGVELSSYRNGTADTHFYNTTLIKSSPTFSGTMSITLNSALTITIPNDQLIFDERYIDSSGPIMSNATSKQIPIVRIPQGNGMMPRIGGMFFSSAYLMVNHDKGEFTIAAAPTKSATPKLMAFDTANNCVAQVVAAQASGSPNPTSTNTNSNSGSSNNNNNNNPESSTSSSSDSKLGGGAIAGIVIGALAGLALIAGLAFLLWRRKTRANARPAELSGSETTGPVEKYAYHDASEMYAENGHELPGGYRDGNVVAYEMDGGGRRV